MENAFLHKLGRILWRALVAAIVLLAVYVSLGRLLMGAVGDYQDVILDELNRGLPFTITAERVSGEWRSFSPELVLSGLRLHLQREPEVAVRLREGRVRLDVLGSLLTASLQASRLQLVALDLPLQLGADGRLRLQGFSGGTGELGQWVKDLVLNIEHLALTDNQLAVTLPGGDVRDLAVDLQLRRDGSRRELVGSLLTRASGTRVDLVAHALGDPLEPDTLEGEAYLRAIGADLATLEGWLPRERLRGIRASGELDAEVWLSWREGEPELETRVSGRGLRVAGGGEGAGHGGRKAWEFPLDHLGFAASVQREDNSWSVYTRDVAMARGDIDLLVPRLQLDLWGDSLRLRGEEVPLGPVTALYAAFPATHPALSEALATLDAGARLGRVEFSLDDVRAPARGWQLAANFSEFHVQSWRGAPGMRSGEGFVRLSPGEGRVILDSRQFSMDFPTVYDHSLDYDDIHGTVDVAWGAGALTLRSGLITATGDEGTSRALFGLRVPFTETRAGVEMDLLVGLKESSAGYRHKYLPSVLHPKLLDWLRDGPGEGAVNQGAFLWRGSLRRDAAPLRTVQLFFDISDASVTYQPDWPALSGLEGLVLIDDTDVSVWADRARLYDSSLESLSAEAWMTPNRDMRLAVSGRMQGPAADGLRLVRESPLAELSGHVFDEWALTGNLQTRLALELDLVEGGAAPRVQVATQLEGGDLEIAPLDLSVQAVSGAVNYDSDTGFSSRDLVGRLWGEPIEANLAREASTGPVGEGAGDGLRVELAGRLDAEPLQAWLGLGGRSLARGIAPVTAVVRAGGGATPTLRVASGLEGMALNLPAPLGKTADESLPLDLGLALAGPGRRFDLALGRRLDMALLLGADANPLGGEVALQDTAAEPEAGRLRLSGHTAVIDSRQWRDLLRGLSADTAGVQANVLPAIIVDDLLVDTLTVGGAKLNAVLLNARQRDDGGWRVRAETDWLQGTVELEPGLERGAVRLSHLELDGLSALGGGDAGPVQTGAFPQLAVRADSITRGGRPLGHLQFELRSTPWAVRAASISGEIAGLTLSPESPGELLWRRGAEAGNSRSSLSARLDFEDLGDVFQKLGYEQILETDDGHFDLALDWPGAPQDFALAAIAGRLNIDVDSGRFLDASAGASGTLRVVSILNLAEIVRRLSLTHMFESGIPFDDVDGEVFFHSGTIEVPSLAVRGASSSFAFSGISPIDSRRLDGELVATLPVANNLPWVAALTAGLPVAAGVFVVSKVFEQQMNRMTSAVYSVEGNWDDPEVRFSRIFDTGRQRTPVAEADNDDSPASTPSR